MEYTILEGHLPINEENETSGELSGTLSGTQSGTLSGTQQKKDDDNSPADNKAKFNETIQKILSNAAVDEKIAKKYNGISMKAKDTNVNKAFDALLINLQKMDEVITAFSQENGQQPTLMKNLVENLKKWGDFVSKNDNKSLSVDLETKDVIKDMQTNLRKANEYYRNNDVANGNKIVDELIKKYPKSTELLSKYKH